jgi:CheY-like chemotaxis protein
MDGLRRFYGDRPDLVVLDIAMPVMDGWQVLERLREVSDVPVLILTALEFSVLRQLSEGLLGFDEDLHLIPLVATEVPTVQNGCISDDGLTYTLKLRDGLFGVTANR